MCLALKREKGLDAGGEDSITIVENTEGGKEDEKVG